LLKQPQGQEIATFVEGLKQTRVQTAD